MRYWNRCQMTSDRRAVHRCTDAGWYNYCCDNWWQCGYVPDRECSYMCTPSHYYAEYRGYCCPPSAERLPESLRTKDALSMPVLAGAFAWVMAGVVLSFAACRHM